MTLNVGCASNAYRNVFFRFSGLSTSAIQITTLVSQKMSAMVVTMSQQQNDGILRGAVVKSSLLKALDPVNRFK
jgi:hypothetical protein